MKWTNKISPRLIPGFRAKLFRDLAVAEEGLGRACALLAGSIDSFHLEHLRQAKLELSTTKVRLAQNQLRYAREHLDDTLWWIGFILIAFEPEYLQVLFGERPIINQLFWRWNRSMGWDSADAIVHREAIRKKRLQLYRIIEEVSRLGGANEELLGRAREYLCKRDYPNVHETMVARIQTVYLDEGLSLVDLARPHR